jgi:hypothetical protein
MTKYRICESQLTGKFTIEFLVEEKTHRLWPTTPGYWSNNWWPFPSAEFETLDQAKSAIKERVEMERKARLPKIIHHYP